MSQAGVDKTNFFMGHSTSHNAPEIPRSDDHYFSRTAIEKYRKIYRDKIMPFLRLESRTPGETEQTIMELRSQLAALREQLRKGPKLDPLLQEIEALSRLPGYRQVFADVVEYVKTKFAGQIKQEKVIKKD